MSSARRLFVLGIAMLVILLAVPLAVNAQEGTVDTTPYGTLEDGTEITEYTLTNANGIEVKIIEYGGIITSIMAPDRYGNMENVVLGFSSLEDYVELNPGPHFGAIIGRYGNRIADAQFTLEGETYTLPANNGPNTLHGGKGFDERAWEGSEFTNDEGVGVEMSRTSPNGEDGFPGALDVTVTYTLTNADELRIDYTATTDQTTVVNLTNHTYWNLDGNGDGTIYDHYLMINADRYTPVDDTLIPTGELAPVEGTPFDFRTATQVGAGIRSSHPQMLIGRGYDHNWVLNQEDMGAMTLAARLQDPDSGRVLEVMTTEPGMQFYAGNFLHGDIVGSSGEMYRMGDGLALETQHYPDSPNQPDFPSTTLTPDETYETTTIFRLTTDR